jgi:pantoate--beta-alanine ligase
VIVAETRAQLRMTLGDRASPVGPVTFVPTMGALHDGHARLLDLAASRPGRLVVSIFINPLQFGPGEDLARYPRPLEADLSLCRAHGVDVVFTPAVSQMYPTGEPLVTVDPGPLGSILEGASRPGHFRGVLTVVAKLFGLVRPDAAIFGAKDYQQLVLVSRMVEDLCLPVEVVAAPTVREPDGLALSSRNRYLNQTERRWAGALSRALVAGRAAGPRGRTAVLAAAQALLSAEPGVFVDYVSLTSPDLGEPAPSGEARLLVAATVGTTRLIDNVAVELRPVPGVRHDLPS